MNASEQLTARKAELRTKSARLEELMGKDTLDDQETDELETLTPEVKSLSGAVDRLETLEAAQRVFARPVAAPVETKTTTTPPQLQARVEDVKLPPGIAFTRVFMCKVASTLSIMRGEFKSAEMIAKEVYPSDQRLQLAVKAAIAPATTTHATWAGPFVYAETIADFVEYLRPMTILGKFGTDGIPSLNRVPFNSRSVSQTSGGTAYWVGQAKPKPLTKFDFAAASLGFAKVAVITVLAEELFKFGNHPSVSAETAARNGLTSAIRERLDIDFIDPNQAAVANVNPASITNGLSALSPSGTDADAVRADVGTLIDAFLADNVDPSNLVLIMPPGLALRVALLRNGLGGKEFDGLTMSGGRLDGIPVITSQYAANQSGAGNLVIAVNASDIYLADDGGVNVDLSREASVEMSDAPTQDGSVPTGSSMVSLWQNNLVGIRAERFINWAKRRSNAVVYMDDVAWGGAGSPS